MMDLASRKIDHLWDISWILFKPGISPKWRISMVRHHRRIMRFVPVAGHGSDFSENDQIAEKRFCLQHKLVSPFQIVDLMWSMGFSPFCF